MLRRRANTPLRRSYLRPGSDPPPTFVTGGAPKVNPEHPRDGRDGKVKQEEGKKGRKGGSRDVR